MKIFEEAEREWQQLLANATWPSPVFGDTYYIRYPIDVGTKEASHYKQSVFKGDDSVHMWDASAVRKKIISRLVESHEMKIRPWYGEVSYFSDSIRFLTPLPESELDFILRTSLISTNPKEHQISVDARNKLLFGLDPDLNEKPKQISDTEFFGPQDRAKRYSRTQIELYGLFNITKDRIFALNDNELREIIDFMMNPNLTDKFLVKRFVESRLTESKPLIGQENPDIKNSSNFMLKYFGGEDVEFYKRRIFQLWLRNLLDFSSKAKVYIEDRKADLFLDIKTEEEMKSILFLALKLHKWVTVKDRLVNRLKNEYCTKKDFSGYKIEMIHLLADRDQLFKELVAETNINLLIDLSEYSPRYICHAFGISMIESILNYLSKQIPEPQGVGGKIQSRMLLNKRINNMKKFVLTDEMRDEILTKISNIYELITEDTIQEEFEQRIRDPYNRLMPRGEQYFKDMEAEVRIILQETEDRDLRKELAAITDTPQSLVRQYGKKALEMVEEGANLTDLYSTILALKSRELVFSGDTLTALKRQNINSSLVKDLFSHQFKFIKLLLEEEARSKQEDQL